MRIYRFIVPILVVGLSLSCEETEEVVPAPVKFPNVDPELRTYFQRFEDEARARGLSVDLTESGISGEIVEIEDRHVLGQCFYPRSSPNRVTVDQTFWSRGSDLFREFVVFHELGHCFLFRPHLEQQLSNGACVSIMRSGNGTCLDNYNFRTRNSYVDELFDYQPSLAAVP